LGGLGFGRADSTLTFDNDMGRSDITSTFGSIYGSWFSKSAYLDGAVAYGRQSFESTRHIRIGEVAQTAGSDYGGDLYFAFVQSGMNLGLGNWLIQPFAGLQFAHLRQESHQESGAEGVNLHVDSRSSNSLLSDLGLRLARPFKKSNLLFIPEVQLAWRHDFDLDDGLTTASLDGLPAMTFKTKGGNGNLNSAIMEFGLTCQTMGGLSFQVNYNAELGSNYNGHQLSGEVRFEF
jgi:outer membrane autotransporter protein